MTLNMQIAKLNGSTQERLRAENDFYPTPVEATEALLRWLPADWPRRVWEPACGDGAISRRLKAHGFEVYSSDLIGRGYGDGGLDFLEARPVTPFEALITNPPFVLAEQFIRKARQLNISHMAMLLKATYWHAKKRLPLFEEWWPAFVLPLTWRLDFLNLGSPPMDMSWYVWLPGATQTQYQPLAKPVFTDVLS